VLGGCCDFVIFAWADTNSLSQETLMTHGQGRSLIYPAWNFIDPSTVYGKLKYIKIFTVDIFIRRKNENLSLFIGDSGLDRWEYGGRM
jgi:hypothetical protein